MAAPTCGSDQSMNPGSPGRRERRTPASALVLVIDDERSVRLALRRYFERSGWQVEEAEDGAQALRLLERPEASAYRLVVTDLRMPGKTGLEVHDWLAAERPELFGRLLIATGDTTSPDIQAFIQRTTRPVLEKPFKLSTLAALVELVVRGEGDRAVGR
jgi:two-component system NtrC family sensor kinase